MGNQMTAANRYQDETYVCFTVRCWNILNEVARRIRKMNAKLPSACGGNSSHSMLVLYPARMATTPAATVRFHTTQVIGSSRRNGRRTRNKRACSQSSVPTAAIDAQPYPTMLRCTGRTRPNVSHSNCERKVGLCILIDASIANRLPASSQNNALVKYQTTVC